MVTPTKSFVLETADTGKTLLAAFTKFVTYRKAEDHTLENVYSTLSITANTLEELGSTINQHKDHFFVKDELTRPITETCKSNFDTLLTMVNECIAGGVWKNDGTLGGKACTTESDPWFLITLGLGGRKKAKIFWDCLHTSRDTLLELNDTIKYMIFKDLSQKKCMNAEQTEEFKGMVTLLPHLVHRLEKAEKMRQKAEKEKKEEEEFAARMASRRRMDSDEFSERTLALNPEPRITRPRKIGKDIDLLGSDLGSTYSRRTSISSYVAPQPEDIYEEWSLKWNAPSNDVDYSWSFMGIKFKRRFEDSRNGYWNVDSEYRTQAEMKEQHNYAAANLDAGEQKTAILKAVQALPKNGGREIDHLIEDRIQFSSNERAKTQWTVVAVRPVQKYPYSCTKKWGKDPKTTNWLVTIKGETVDTEERGRAYRREDPWNKRDRSRPRYDDYRRSPRRHVYNEERAHHVRSWTPSPDRRRNIFVRNRPHSPAPACVRGAIVNDGFKVGNMAIGKIMTKEEAEKKMDEIWEGMVNPETKKEAAPETKDETGLVF